MAREKTNVQNVKMTVKANKLTIEVDLSQRNGKSASGKTTIIASTQGNQSIPGDASGAVIGLNVYTRES